jgi:4,5-dihydroxyphthalate decarboxylase
MANLKITLACWNYDRTRGLMDGSICPDGVDLTYRMMFVAEIFERMVRNKEFEVSELGFTFYLRSLELENPPFVAIPVFPLRFFRHAAIFVNTESGISLPKDLVDKNVGEMLCYGHDSGIWSKGILSDDYGVPTDSYTYHVGPIDERPRPQADWLPFKAPSNVRLNHLRPGQNLDAMLVSGEIAALYSAIVPRSLLQGSPKVKRLFDDYEAVERDYFRRTSIFPIMHTVVLRRDVYQDNPWLAQSLCDAFQAAKDQAWNLYKAGDAFNSASIMIPWFMAHREQNQKLLGDDYWPYGLEPNRKVLDTFLRYHYEQGILKRRWQIEELFAPETLTWEPNPHSK